MGVSSIEKLELKRKEHPNTHAIYLLSPTKESISLLISDFEGQALQLKNTDEKKKKKAEKQKEKEKKKKKKKKGKQDDDNDDDEDEQDKDEDNEVIEENEENKNKRKQEESEPKKPEKKKDDQQPPEIQYARVHIFFMNKLPKYLLEEMGKSEKLVKRIRTMKEFNHSFFFFEQNGFHLHLEQSLPILFSKKDSQEAKIMFECICDQLITVLPALLRFDKINILYNDQNQNSPSYLFANYFEKKLQEMILKLKESESLYIDPTAGEIYLILVDRGIDPVTPLLHDYSYQSMIYDLLEVDTEKNIVEYEKVELKKENNKANEPTKEVKKYKQQLSDHKDEVFAKFRYQNITEALKGIRDDFEKHTENMQRAKASQNQVRSIEDVNKIIGEFPEYNELLQKYAVHFDLILKCFNTFQKYNLQLNCELEQSMVTGIDDLAKPIKSDTIIQSIMDILSRKDIKSGDRVRIAMIAFITCDLQQDQRLKILGLFEVSEQKLLKNLAWLGIQFSDDKNSNFSRVNQQIIDLSKEQYNVYLDKQKNCSECKKIRAEAKKSKKGGNADEDQKRDCDECGQLYFVFSVMRHTPLSAIAIHSAIKQIIKSQDVSKDRLNSLGFGIKSVGQINKSVSPLKEQAQLTEDTEMQSENKLQSTSSKQSKSTKKKDKDKKKDKEESKQQQKDKGDLHQANEYEAFLQQSESEDPDALKKSKKIIAFFIGGVSYAEIRAIRKFQDEYQSNPVIIGATHLLTHHNYLEGIEQMSTFG
ncbi:hypothetical protein ABPG72_018004 [Tetrahymena utriculariae]